MKKEILWSQESSQDGAVFYALDLNSGEVIEEHDIPAREVGGVLTAGNGVLYLYTYSGLTHPGNELLRFDPRKRKIERLGLAKTPRNRCVDGIIGRDGSVYIGTHQQGRLFQLNVSSRKWTDLGQMVPAPLKSRPNIWLRNLQLAPNGKILGAIATSPPPKVVEIDPENSSFRLIDAIHSKDFVVYGKHILVPTGKGLAVYDQTYRKMAMIASDANARLSLAAANKRVGILAQINRKLVRINLETRSLDKLATLPWPGTIVASEHSRRAVLINHALQKFAVINLDTGEFSERKIGYSGRRGTQICGLNKAADGSIYGTNIIGMHLFRYDPKTNKSRDLGHVGWPGGEVYNVIDVGGKIYFGTYGGGHWGVYDPHKAWRPDFVTAGRTPGANPRYLGQLGGDDPNAVNRPFEYAELKGKIYIAARANYGHRGGALVEFDPKTEKNHVYRDIKRSVQSVTVGRNFVFGSTNIRGGRGSGIHVKNCTVFLFDPKQGKRIREQSVDSTAIGCVRFNKHDGLLYATDDKQRLLAFDGRTLKSKKSWSIRSPGSPLAGVPEHPGIIHITVASDGDVNGVTSKDLFRLDRKNGMIEYLDQPPIPNLYQIVEGEPGVFYVGAQTHLLKYYVKAPQFYR